MGNKLAIRRQVIDDRYTRPQGLYAQKDLNYKKLRELILDSKLAPCYPGEDEFTADFEECPICFLYYPSLNRSKCCMKCICTECFLQMKPASTTCPTKCPFCKTSNYGVEYRGVRTKEEKVSEQVEEQRVIEAKIRMQQRELEDEHERWIRKQEDISSRLTMSGEINYDDMPTSAVAVSSVRPPPEIPQTVPPQDSHDLHAIRCMPHLRENRTNGTELGLEDIMVMEAIWLSLQQKKAFRKLHRATPSSPFLEEHLAPSAVTPMESSSFGRLDCPIAGLDQHLHTSGQNPSNATENKSEYDMPCQSNQFSTSDERSYDHYPHERLIELSLDDGMPRTYKREQSEGHSFDIADSTGSNATVMLRSAFELNEGDGHVLQPSIVGTPDSFEEQMMLAMAISLADAEAQSGS